MRSATRRTGARWGGAQGCLQVKLARGTGGGQRGERNQRHVARGNQVVTPSQALEAPKSIVGARKEAVLPRTGKPPDRLKPPNRCTDGRNK